MSFDFSGLSPMETGRAEKHLNTKIRYEGKIMTNRELYSQAVSKRDIGDSKGRPSPVLVFGDGSGVEVPRSIYNAFIAKI